MTPHDPQAALDGPEQILLDHVSITEPWALVERFSALARVSGSDEERTGADYISDRLYALGVPHQLHEPELFLSIPRSARVDLGAPHDLSLHAKTPAFSLSTGSEGVTGEVVYVPRREGADPAHIFTPEMDDRGLDVHGKIVLFEGFSGPDEVDFFAQRGAIGHIFINPGKRIHWSICTTIWGTPDLDSIERKPQVVALDVNREDGDRLIRLAQEGGLQATLHAQLDEGWYKCPLIVAEIPGTLEPEKFLLVHGHHDSWDVGVGDNATGAAALIELARVLWDHRRHLKRSVRIAWWPGHSTGRYAGSTWYADTFALDLAENCIAHLDIDSPGCRWADHFEQVCWMSELDAFCRQAIRDVTGADSRGVRPFRAGDYSFNNLGISGFFMLLSEMSEEQRQKMGYYAVGGCGGNIAWHTEDDRLEIADPDNLVRDIKVYAAAVLRMINAALLPFDYRRTVAEMSNTVAAYQQAAGEHFSFAAVQEALTALARDLDAFYARLASLAQGDPADPRAQAANNALIALSRLLVNLDYSRQGRFRQDPAVAIDALPDLAFARRLPELVPQSDAYRFCLTQLLRGRNHVIHTLRQARRILAEP
jgi:hypothetical protein